MKMIIFSAVFLISLLRAGAADLQTVKGVVFHNVTIISADPDRMLIVHDGGGCQVAYKDLKPDSLTPDQREKVEEELNDYTQRSKRLEKIRMETEVFEAEQRQKGLLKFEGGWVSLQELEEIVIAREERKIDLERKRVQLAKEKAELEQQRLQTEKARYLLEGESRRGTTYITYGYTSRSSRNCFYPTPYRYGWHGSKPRNSTYITTDGAAAYNRGPFNR